MDKYYNIAKDTENFLRQLFPEYFINIKVEYNKEELRHEFIMTCVIRGKTYYTANYIKDSWDEALKNHSLNNYFKHNRRAIEDMTSRMSLESH